MSWTRLGNEVRSRRTELGLTQVDVADRGGPSVETLRAVENDRAGRLSPRMRRALERVLRWQSGSIDAVLAGGVVDAGPTRPQAGAVPQLALARQVLSMRAAVERHADGITQEAGEGLTAELDRAAREAEDAVVAVLPLLDDADRTEAIRLLTGLRPAFRRARDRRWV
jgi:transcriptional regulator with XRE-family HTH domain